MNRRKKVLLLMNSAAGVGAARSKAYDIIKGLAVRNCQVTAYPILPEEGLESEQLIGELADDYDMIMCCGGDGTLNHVIRGMMKNSCTLPLAYLPSGSTNDFAKSIGVPADTDENCRVAAGTHTFAYDIGRFNTSYFNYVAAFGAFTRVSYATNQAAKNVLGYGAYILEGIHSLPESMTSRYHLRIEHDGGTEEGDYLFGSVSNATSMGGISSPAIKKASLDDGLFEVMLVSAPENIVEVGEIISNLASGSIDNQHIRMFHASRLHIEATEKVSWTLDGEYGGDLRKVDIKVCPRAIKIMVP